MTTYVRKVACCAALALAASGLALAQSGDKVERIPLANPDIPISSAVVVPAGYDTIYVSGHIAKVADANAPRAAPKCTATPRPKPSLCCSRSRTALAAQQLSMADVVMVHVFLVGDPANGGKMDFAGMNAGYTQFFGTKQQPNKAARSAVQVMALAAPGALVEIEAIAVRKHVTPLMHNATQK